MAVSIENFSIELFYKGEQRNREVAGRDGSREISVISEFKQSTQGTVGVLRSMC